ncbi:mitotic-spindle organizing gamma-tubulin ring associated-domain-containing protein, partial [Cladochytrium replicatum]
ERLDILFETSRLLNTGLDRALAICVSMCEQGVNPEALTAAIKELRRVRATRDDRKVDWSFS